MWAPRFHPVLEALDGRRPLGEVLERFGEDGLFDDEEGSDFHDFVVREHYHFTR